MRVLVPDTSVFVSGRLSALIEQGELSDCEIVIPEAAMAELEHHAAQGRETGVTGIDEVTRLQKLKGGAQVRVRFAGERPHPEDLALDAEIHDLVRQVVEDARGELVTSDRVQAHMARARGLSVWYLHPYGEESAKGTEELSILRFFDEHTMSVHLKVDCPPIAKRGTPGNVQLTPVGRDPLQHAYLSQMARELIEAARRNPDSFVEIERTGATVCQIGPLRVVIARPPFSDGIEITAVRPVARLTIDQYELPEEVHERIMEGSRGIFISGPPGSGKSTFAQAVASALHGMDRVVKTMESPRDLQVPPEITQYAPLDRSMELTGDVILLVRPDHVIYDEVRKTEDFAIFADMRLAGIGLIGVTHANRGIDAVQRLLNRVDLGMIPQVVDTVVHIKSGKIEQILELKLTVKVPAGMMEADLARPVVVVSDFQTKRAAYEIYTYGEQTVVMPLEETERGPKGKRDQLAEGQLVHLLRRHISGDYEVQFAGANRATVFVDEDEIAHLIGPGGSNVKRLEAQLGVKLDLRPFEREDRTTQRDAAKRVGEMRPQLRKTGKHIILILEPALSGKMADVVVDGEPLFQATIGRKGEIRVRRASPEGKAVLTAYEEGEGVSVRV